MFEKEAEAKYKEHLADSNYYESSEEESYLHGFTEGAEFGYKTANEWHFTKDGEYPANEKDVQVLYQDCDKIKVYNCVYDVQAKNWLYHNLDNMVLELFPFTVIAWKEIVLPKEIEA